MSIPFVNGGIEHGDATDREFEQGRVENGAGADGAEKSVPAIGDGRRMQQGEVEGDQGAGMAAGGDAGVDVGCFGGWRGGRRRVREAHFEREREAME